MKSKFYFLLIFLFSFITSIAQQKTVSGRVTKENGDAISGVTVSVKGTKTATATNNDGRFTIAVPEKANTVLLFSSVGFKAQQINVGSQTSLSIAMQEDAASLEDVVVIGYQSIRRKNLLASVSSVTAKELKDIPINSAAEALNGRLAGVTATTSEGSPDANVRIRVRGGMSITQDNSPLFIIDGVQVENGLNSISPQDIQSIDVLKDAAATAIYGARGANGVIVISTKVGKPGKLILSYNGFIGVRKLAKTLDVMSPYEYVLYQSERARGNSTDSLIFLKNFGGYTGFDTLNVYKNIDPVNWQKEVFGNTGIATTHNVSASGGNKKITYNFGYTYNNEKAVVLSSSYKRHLLNLKGDYKITKKLKVGLGTRYTLQNVYGAGVSSEQGSSYNRLRNAVKYRPFLAAGKELEDQDPIADPNVGNGLNLINPIALSKAEYRRKTTEIFNITANASYNITKNFVFRSTFGYDQNNIIDRQFSDSITPYSMIQGGKLPIAGLDTVDRKTITNSNVFTYSIKNFKQKHDFDFLVGEETYDLRTESHSSLFRNYPAFTSYSDAFKNTTIATAFSGYPRVGKSRYTSLSFFGRVNYSLLDRYLFSFNLRADGASKFAPGKQWGYFPAASFAWRVKNEKFLRDNNFINDLKFRAGFGTVGNNRIRDYLFLTTFSNNGSYYYGLNNQTVIPYYPTSLVNPNLKWESTVNRNFGMDISLLKNRIDLSIDVYNNSSRDLLVSVPTPSTYGYTEQLQNIGKTTNKGVEVQLNAVILKKANNFGWTANFNISTNKNNVVALGANQPYISASGWFNSAPYDYIVKVGSPVGSMYGYVTDGFYTVNDFNFTPGANGYGIYTLKAGVPSNASAIGTAQPGNLKFKDLNGDGIIDDINDRQIIGNPNPKFTGGLNQQFTYKQWDASLFLNFSYGNDVYNANKLEFTNGFTANSNMLSLMENRWRVITPAGQTAQFISNGQVIGLPPDQLAALNANATIWQPTRATGAGSFLAHSWAIEDGSFLRINNLTVGYSLPVKILTGLKMSKLRFYFTANNLAVFTSYSGYDPEVSVRNSPLVLGLDYSAYPKSRSFIFGVNATF
ncbi:MAG: TonB-dependent receptor [Bacteroidota bacterium]|nr:TonB-dependent receptor [Bacteroidota bacterium]